LGQNKVLVLHRVLMVGGRDLVGGSLVCQRFSKVGGSFQVNISRVPLINQDFFGPSTGFIFKRVTLVFIQFNSMLCDKAYPLSTVGIPFLR
jgi:hypothetical protein